MGFLMTASESLLAESPMMF